MTSNLVSINCNIQSRKTYDTAENRKPFWAPSLLAQFAQSWSHLLTSAASFCLVLAGSVACLDSRGHWMDSKPTREDHSWADSQYTEIAPPLAFPFLARRREKLCCNIEFFAAISMLTMMWIMLLLINPCHTHANPSRSSSIRSLRPTG